MKKKSREQRLSREYYYASHHHLIPLYVLSGISLLAVLVMGCFLAVLWESNERDIYTPYAHYNIRALENEYLPAAVEPAEKKQYLFPAAVRFAVDDPYDILRYSYDPAVPAIKTTSTFTLTTSKTLQDIAAPMFSNPEKIPEYLPRMVQCAKLYILRFEPGATPDGGFVPFKDIALKDGRTAYVHKNTGCVPNSTQAMNALEKIEKIILSVESY